jgi:hypothetical protein
MVRTEMYLDMYPYSHLELLAGNGDNSIAVTLLILGLTAVITVTCYRDESSSWNQVPE